MPLLSYATTFATVVAAAMLVTTQTTPSTEVAISCPPTATNCRLLIVIALAVTRSELSALKDAVVTSAQVIESGALQIPVLELPNPTLTERAVSCGKSYATPEMVYELGPCAGCAVNDPGVISGLVTIMLPSVPI